MRKEERGALTTIAEFIYNVVDENNHLRALSSMDLSDDGFVDDLDILGLFELNPELRDILIKRNVIVVDRL